MQQQQNRHSPIEGLIVVGLVFWLFFMGGLSALKSAKVPSTIGTGVQRLVGTAGAIATERPLSLTAPTSAVAIGSRNGRDVTLPNPPARGAGAGAGAGSSSQTVATTAPTAAPAPTASPMIAGGAPPAAAPAALGYAVPVGQHTDINPDGSFTVDGGNIRYYPNTDNVVVEIRVVDKSYEPDHAAEGAPPEQKIFLDPANPTDAAYLAQQPTAAPNSGKTCGGRTRNCK